MLKLKRKAKEFSDKLARKNEKLLPLIKSDINSAWELFHQNVHSVAKELLKTVKARVPEEDAIDKKYAKALGLLRHPRVIDIRSHYNSLSDFPRRDPDIITNVGIVRRQHRQAKRQHAHSVVLGALEKIEATSHVSVRTNQTFKLLRALKQKTTAQSNISLQALNQELCVLDHGMVLPVPETDGFPLPRPPGSRTLIPFYDRLECGIAPGPDYLFNEFLKYVEEVRTRIAQFIKQAYLANKVPKMWHETSMFLLPKKAKSITYNEHRPITLCCLPYKIYAHYLLEELKEYLPVIPEYQNGFLNNRSTDDSVFFLNRILETHWNHGKPLYVLTLDLEKAFSSVNIHQMPKILLEMGAPAFLVNRIVEVCLYERTRILHNGQETLSYVKTVGIKQGCPISPFLFIIVFHYLLSTTQQQLLQLTPPLKLYLGEINEDITMPAISAYADDLTILASSINHLQRLLPVLISNLKTYGLSINATKSVLLLKSDNQQLHTQLGATLSTAGLIIPVKQNVVILGTQVNSDMKRRRFVSFRTNKALNVYHSLLQQLKSQKLAYDVLVRLYCAILVPIMLYGLRAVSLTKAEKRMLMHREVQMLRGLSKIASPSPRNETIRKILRGRTINRALTVSRILYYSHITRSPRMSILRKAYSYRMNIKRKKGRPCDTYKTFLGKEFASMKKPTPGEWIRGFASADLAKKICQQIYDTTQACNDPMPINLRMFPTLN